MLAVVVIVPAHHGRASDPRPSLFAELPTWFGPVLILTAVVGMILLTRRLNRT